MAFCRLRGISVCKGSGSFCFRHGLAAGDKSLDPGMEDCQTCAQLEQPVLQAFPVRLVCTALQPYLCSRGNVDRMLPVGCITPYCRQRMQNAFYTKMTQGKMQQRWTRGAHRTELSYGSP